MKLASKEQEAFNHLGSRWWGGPDEGDEVIVTLRFRKPTTREHKSVLELFSAFLDSIDGGYGHRVEVEPFTSLVADKDGDG